MVSERGLLYEFSVTQSTCIGPRTCMDAFVNVEACGVDKTAAASVTFVVSLP